MSQKPTPAQKKALFVKLAIVGGVLGAVALLVLWGIDVRALLEQGLALVREAGPMVFFMSMALLPAVGFPLSPFWLGAGPAFAGSLGLPLVIALAGLSLLINLLLTYWLARYALRPPLSWLVRRMGYELPRVAAEDRLSLTLLVRVTPGPPYFIQSYLLGLAEIPFRMYVLVSWPLSMAFGVVFLFFGDSLAQGKGKLALLAFGGLVALGVGFRFLRRWLMKKKQRATGAENLDTTPSVEKCP